MSKINELQKAKKRLSKQMPELDCYAKKEKKYETWVPVK